MKIKKTLKILSLFILILGITFTVKNCKALNQYNFEPEYLVNKFFASKDKHYFLTFYDETTGLFYHQNIYDDFTFYQKSNIFFLEQKNNDFYLELIVSSNSSFYCPKYNTYLHLLGGNR